MGEGRRVEEVASSKKKRIEDWSANSGKMAEIDTLFMTKTAEKPYLWGRTYLYRSYKGAPPRDILAKFLSLRFYGPRRSRGQ